MADVLFGDVSPAGRLPVTFYSADEKLPAFDDYDMTGRTYRYFGGKPLYPFGHGLSYTTFDYRDLRLDRDRAGVDDTLTATVIVRNSGQRASDEVVQLYLRPLAPVRERARRELRGFQRVHLAPGESRQLRFEFVPSRDLRHYDEAAGGYAVDPGRYAVEIGASSGDLRIGSQFEVEAP